MIPLQIQNFCQELPKISPAELQGKLISILEEIKSYGIDQVLISYPDFFARLLNQIKKSQPAELFSENSKAADLFSDLLWEGIAGQMAQRAESKAVLQKAHRKMRINIEASDSSFKNHFIVQEGRLARFWPASFQG